MRKIFAIILSIALCTSIAGCKKETVQEITRYQIVTAGGFTGFVAPVAPNFVVTCWHIAEKESVTVNGYRARLVHRDEVNDIAVYKTEYTFIEYYTIATTVGGAQIPKSVDFGDSGIPILNKQGELVGIVAGATPPENTPVVNYLQSQSSTIQQVITNNQ